MKKKKKVLSESLKEVMSRMGTKIKTDASCINNNVGNTLIKLCLVSRPHLDTISPLNDTFIVGQSEHIQRRSPRNMKGSEITLTNL